MTDNQRIETQRSDEVLLFKIFSNGVAGEGAMKYARSYISIGSLN